MENTTEIEKHSIRILSETVKIMMDHKKAMIKIIAEVKDKLTDQEMKLQELGLGNLKGLYEENPHIKALLLEIQNISNEISEL